MKKRAAQMSLREERHYETEDTFAVDGGCGYGCG